MGRRCSDEYCTGKSMGEWIEVDVVEVDLRPVLSVSVEVHNF